MVRRQLLDRLSWRTAVEWQRADLLRGISQLPLPPDQLAKVQPLLDEYEQLIDKQLLRLEAVQGKEDEDAAATRNQAVLELRSLNRRYLRLITQELPLEVSARLTRWAHERIYTRMNHWNASNLREAMDRAKRTIDLTDEQRAKVEALITDTDKRWTALRKEAEPEYDAVDDKTAQMSEKQWKEFSVRRDNPLYALSTRWAAREDEVYLGSEQQFESLLTPSQRAALWPPTGSLRDWVVERSRHNFD